MKENIIEYLVQYGGQTIEERPLNEVDYLVLAQFVYLKLDGYVNSALEEESSVTISWLFANADRDRLFADERYRSVNEQLFDAMAKSRRFSELKLMGYVNIVDTQLETQFCSMTIMMPTQMLLVFRGTDESLIGWKEDFQLAFLEKVPAQEMAVSYLNSVAGINENKMVLMGHSKGGNLAVFSAMAVAHDIQKRIEGIYSMDGPGFRKEILKQMGFDQIKEKVHKYVPQSSLVGMLLESHEDYQVIESNGFLLGQHVPYTWLVKGTEFVPVDAITTGTRYMDSRLNEWISNLSKEELELFTNTLFDTVFSTDTESLLDFSGEWLKRVNQIVAAFKSVDDVTKKQMQEIVRALFQFRNNQDKQRMLHLPRLLTDKDGFGQEKRKEIAEKVESRVRTKTAETGEKVKELVSQTENIVREVIRQQELRVQLVKEQIQKKKGESDISPEETSEGKKDEKRSS